MIPATDDTIAALATAPGSGGLAVLRVSGPEAFTIADRVFRGSAPLALARGHTLHHGWAVEPAREAAGAGEALVPRLDEVVAAVFRAPHSYTREDVVELSCHGGELPARRVLAALLTAGARNAGPGEFTLRAFLNGRIDLAQAEAVADVVRAETVRAHDIAVSQLAGGLSRRVEALIERVSDSVAEVEARVDFAEDVGGVEVPGHVIEAIAAADRELAELLAGARYARAVREGVRVPLVGRPNVGKSSLFNALLGEPRAIVTDLPGTTRDRVSEAIELGGIRVTLSDTAGLRDTEDPVESLGVAGAREALDGCALAVWVVDGAAPLRDDDRRLGAELSARRLLVALNKSDRPAMVGVADVRGMLDGAAPRVVAVSATEGTGLDTLRAAIAGELGAGTASGGTAVAIGNARHAEALARARAALARARRVAETRDPGEIVALELREALTALGDVTGRSIDPDLLERIFSRFCVGK